MEMWIGHRQLSSQIKHDYGTGANSWHVPLPSYGGVQYQVYPVCPIDVFQIEQQCQIENKINKKKSRKKKFIRVGL